MFHTGQKKNSAERKKKFASVTAPCRLLAMNNDYPIMYGSMRGALTSIAFYHKIPGVEIKDHEAFQKWLNERADETDRNAAEFAAKINQKSS